MPSDAEPAGSYCSPTAARSQKDQSQPVIEYETIREKYATQKRDAEEALTKSLARISDTHNLFENDEFIFPLIACQPRFPPYLTALLPHDQIFDPEDLEYKIDKLNAPPKKRMKSDNEKENESKEEPGDINEEDDKEEVDLEKIGSGSPSNSDLDVDNPYLATTKLPKKATAPSVSGQNPTRQYHTAKSHATKSYMDEITRRQNHTET